ncbi:MAG: hypothetical protein H7Y09_08325, partial [Chitinophagaceae bacterium]|nr:hypothetical protein [Anaerolineae bacterium]
MSKTPSLQVILPHDYELAILILPHASGWTLPSLELKEWPEIGFELFNAGMENRSILGHATITLRCPYFERPNDEHGYRFVFVVQNQDNPFQTPEGARWLKQDDLKNLEINDEYLRPVIEIYFSEQVTGKVPVQRSPWAFTGWREKATDWIKMQVAAQNWQIETDIELTRQWCITCVLKASTSVGNVYFKAVLPIFGREISIIRYLAQKHPLHIPTFLAYDVEKH